MTQIKAYYDGKVLVPDESVNLPINQPPMMELLKALDQMPDNPSTPDDLASQHDHHFHGLPKRS